MLGSKHNTDMENKSVPYLKIVTQLKPAIPLYHTTGHAGLNFHDIPPSPVSHCISVYYIFFSFHLSTQLAVN